MRSAKANLARMFTRNRLQVTQKIMRVLLIIGMLIFSISKSIACGCNDPSSVAEAYNYTETVIHGKVIKKSNVSLERAMNSKKTKLLENQYKG